MEKYGAAREAVHDNTEHALGMLDVRTTHTHTHTQYVTLIAFLRQQWSGVRASMLRLHVIVKLPVLLTSFVNFSIFSFLFYILKNVMNIRDEMET